jgi:hypothetical protein
MNRRRSVVIVGGGFVGTAVARQLAGRLPPEVDLTLIAEVSCTTFNPLLPAAEGALPLPEHDLGRVVPYRHPMPELSRKPGAPSARAGARRASAISPDTLPVH